MINNTITNEAHYKIGNGSTFCIRANCGVSSHKKGSTVPYSGMMFVRKNQDSAYVDPGLALDRLDPKILATWRTDKVSFNIWMDRMEAVRRGGEFSTVHEMEEELDLEAKPKPRISRQQGVSRSKTQKKLSIWNGQLMSRVWFKVRIQRTLL
jgi:hypothetical protein